MQKTTSRDNLWFIAFKRLGGVVKSYTLLFYRHRYDTCGLCLLCIA
ncbi:hypothetical protein MNB_SV-6-63 [hydrothermal vent metagenome]|uniref:Uncharacterized protein n=1 Tax=hydrothermal vent metagenome TaxID=652676 RepID=A0A1W1BJN4_9ZZZZ